MTNDFNRYIYCLNNPLMFTDPSGKSWKSFWSDFGNAFVRDFKRTFLSGGPGFELGWNSMGGGFLNATYNGTAFGPSIGISNSWKITSGNIQNGFHQMSPVNYTPEPININVERPKWDGKYYKGTLDEARKMLRDDSHFWNLETSGWLTSRGYYFDKIAGNEYHIDLDYNNPVNGLPTLFYNKSDGYIINKKYSNYRFFQFVDINGNLYNGNGDKYIGTSIFDRARIYEYDHTHRFDINPSENDRDIANYLRLTSNIINWNGNTYNYANFKK